METKQTVVDWLEENLIGNPHFESDFIHNINVFNQAKQMEKEQIMDAAKSCNYIGGATNIEAEQYYNETYKQQDNGMEVNN
jgi:hypothetical protein